MSQKRYKIKNWNQNTYKNRIQFKSYSEQIRYVLLSYYSIAGINRFINISKSQSII